MEPVKAMPVATDTLETLLQKLHRENVSHAVATRMIESLRRMVLATENGLSPEILHSLLRIVIEDQLHKTTTDGIKLAAGKTRPIAFSSQD